MSHFTVTVALPPCEKSDIDKLLDEALAPFYEEVADNRTAIATEYRLSLYKDENCYWVNPQKKWDWWTIGGRWRGRYQARIDASEDDLILSDAAWMNESVELQPCAVDGGRIRALRLDALREKASSKALEDWDQYTRVVAGTPKHEPWSMFVARVTDSSGTTEYTIADARRDYAAQERIQRIRQSVEYREWFDGPEGEFEGRDREAYAAWKREQAVPGWGLLTLDGEWWEKGQMGWFGMSDRTDDAEAVYLAKANTYIDALPDDAWIVLVDCHI